MLAGRVDGWIDWRKGGRKGKGGGSGCEWQAEDMNISGSVLRRYMVFLLLFW